MVFAQGWRRVWFEMDSALTLLNFFKGDYAPPWQVRRRWEKCRAMLSGIEFRASHIFREGNRSADVLSNLALSYEGFHWWDSVFSEILFVTTEDRIGKIQYRFC